MIEKDDAGRHAAGVNAGGVRTLSRQEAEVPLALAALELWYGIGERVGDDCGFESHGRIRVAENEEDAATLTQREARMRALGYAHERWIEADELIARVPALARHCLGGLIAERDGAALPDQTTVAFRRKAESLGQKFFAGVRVDRGQRGGDASAVETDGGTYRAKTLVNCAGP